MFSLYSPKWSTLTNGTSPPLHEPIFSVQTSVKNLRTFTMCNKFSPFSWCDKKLLIFSGTCAVGTHFVTGHFACTKNLLYSSAELNINVFSARQVRINPFEGETNSFFLMCDRGIWNSEETTKTNQDFIGDVICPGKCCSKKVWLCPYEERECRKLLRTSSMRCVLPRFKYSFTRVINQKSCCLAVLLQFFLSETRVVPTKLRKQLQFGRSSSANHKQVSPKRCQKMQKWFLFQHNYVDTLSVDTANQIFSSIFFSYTFSLQ